MVHPFRTLALVAVILVAVIVAIDLTADMIQNYSTKGREASDPSPQPTVPQLRAPGRETPREPGRSFIRAVLDRA